MNDRDDEALKGAGAGDTVILPSDPFWPLRVRVPRDGDPLSFQFHLLYRWQFGSSPSVPDDLQIGDEPIYTQADGTR